MSDLEPLSRVAEAVGVGLAADVPTLVWGAPGIGKSAMLDALRGAGWHVVVLYGSTMSDAADVVGVTVPTERTVGGIKYPAMTRPLPDWMIEVITAQAAGERVVVVIDEATSAPADAMAALLGLLRDGTVAGSPMKPVRRVMIANPADCGANAWTLPAPIGNRVVHLFAGIRADDVIAGFGGTWAPILVPIVPDGWEEGIPAALKEVGETLRAHPEMTHNMPEDPEEQGKAWSSPRTWEMVARMRAACLAANVDETTLKMMVYGAVGKVAGAEYLTRIGRSTKPTWRTCHGAARPKSSTEAVLFAESVAESVVKLFEHGDSEHTSEWHKAWNQAWGYLEVITQAHGLGSVRRAAAIIVQTAQRMGFKAPTPSLYKRIVAGE